MPILPAPSVVIAGRFRLNRLLGRGGMGSVWHATHLGLDIPCAVKFIEGEVAQLPQMQARFEREAKAAAQLRSPHVVQILDHGVSEGTPYIAMELLDGEDLGKRLARLGRLPAHELLPIVAQVGRALTKAHAQGIVHRDLKPDNIFLVRDDDREITKVLDFGIAKASGSGAPGANTQTGTMLGTPYYMSPEQAQGTKTVDARSDLWSLAVIVFEALTGQRPFESEALGDLLMKIIVGPIPRPSQISGVGGDLPPALDDWWAKASRRDPSQRFQTAKELSDGLAVVFGRSGSEVYAAASPPIAASSGGAPASVLGAPSPPFAGTPTGTSVAQTVGGAPGGMTRRTPLVVAISVLVVLGAGIVGAAFVTKDRSVGSGPAVSVASAGGGPLAAPFKAPAAAPDPIESASTMAPVSPPAHENSPAPSSKPPAAARPAPAKLLPVAKAVVATPAAVPTTPPAPAPRVPAAPPPNAEKKTIDLGI
ncbi:MAG: serine/threonine-protein kinase [Polyangiaceae bacterium]